MSLIRIIVCKRLAPVGQKKGGSRKKINISHRRKKEIALKGTRMGVEGENLD